MECLLRAVGLVDGPGRWARGRFIAAAKHFAALRIEQADSAHAAQVTGGLCL